MSAFSPESHDDLDLGFREERSLQFLCPRCAEVASYEASDIPKSGTPVTCPNCDLDLRTRLERPSPGAAVTECWLCGCPELFVQKDLNRTLGLLVIIVAMALSLLMLIIDPVAGLICLTLMVVALGCFYSLLSSCAVCYVCGSVYRGFPANPRHGTHSPILEERNRERQEAWRRSVLEATRSG